MKPQKPLKIDLAQGPNLGNEALGQLAEVTSADIVTATALWDSKTPLKGLLNAKVEEEPK